jgi:hypothetical protein
MKQHPASETLFSPRRIDEILDQTSFCRLACHLANHSLGKGAFFSTEGGPITRDLYEGTLREKIQSTWNCIASYDPLNPKPFALVPYDRHPINHTSTWAALDLDWHENLGPQPHHLSALQRLWGTARHHHKQGVYDAMILEHSGLGAHLWLISRKAHPVTDWSTLLQDLLKASGGVNFPGLELYPASTVPTTMGHALRLPGSVNVMRFNPRDGCPISEIVAHRGLPELIDQLPDPPSNNKSIYIGKTLAPDLPGKAAKAKAVKQEKEWLAHHCIRTPRTRHNQARRLIIVSAFQRTPDDVLRLCQDLHCSASCAPATPLEEHLGDCRQMLADWKKKVCQTLLTAEESQSLKDLVNPRHQLAFLAIHNFHRLALIQGKRDFAISSEALGRATGTSYKTAIADLEHFIALGILERTASAVRRVSCARYRWLLDHLSGEEVRRSWKQLGWEVPVPI